MPTLVPGEALVAREPLGRDRADGGVERQRRAHEDLRAREPPGRAHELARDDQVEARRAHRASMSHANLGVHAHAQRARYPDASRESQSLVPLADHRAQSAADRAVLLHLPRDARTRTRPGSRASSTAAGTTTTTTAAAASRASSRRRRPGGPASAAARRGRARRSPRCAACRCAARRAGAPSRCARTTRARCPQRTARDRRLLCDGEHMRFLILGSGPAGYAAASTAAALGAEVTIVDRMALGGNWTMTDGIPSKTLLQVASVDGRDRARRVARRSSSSTGARRVDLLRAEAHARFIGQHQSRGVRERLDLIEATIVYGQGAIEQRRRARSSRPSAARARSSTTTCSSCTGAAPWEPPFAQVDHQRVLNTRDVLGLHALPEQLLVVGAGATGCEFAEFFQSCGSRVHAALVAPADPALGGSRHRRRRARGVPASAAWRSSWARAPPTSSATASCVRVTAEDGRQLHAARTRSSAWACARTPTSSASSRSASRSARAARS